MGRIWQTAVLLFLTLLAGFSRSVQAQSGNALDRIDFGNPTSEAAHSFDLGATTLPLSGTGALGQTYRQPFGSGSVPPALSEITFTLRCSPALQNYLTVKLWGSDQQQAGLYLNNGPGVYGWIDSNGGPPPFPNRFHYETVPIPISWTLGKTSVQMQLVAAADSAKPARPLYSAFSHTGPRFAPNLGDATGNKPAEDGFRKPAALTASQIIGLLQGFRQKLYGAGGYYDALLTHQISPGAKGAPPEVIGLHLNNDPAAESGSATPEQWRDDAYNSAGGPGYSKFPDEMVSTLVSTYFLLPFKDGSDNVVAGLDHYHDSTIISRLVSALDGCTYLQVGDGGFGQNYNEWQGLTSTPRASTSQWAGKMGRAPGWGLSLEGVDSETLGYTLIKLLNDPTASPLLKRDLGQSYDADLNGGSMLRATAYERMLHNHITYCDKITGGTQSQNMFMELGMYACQIALNKLQALYPNPNFSGVGEAVAVNRVKMVLGLSPDDMGGTNPAYYGGEGAGLTNYGMTPGGFGEAHGALSSGYDGRYGQILPWLAPRFAQLVSWDTGVDAVTRRQVNAQAKAAVDGFDTFISPGENAGISNGRPFNHFTLAPEDFITYRDPYNPNADGGSFEVNSQYLASDPNGLLQAPYALRSAYLQALYGITPGTGAGGHASVQYLKDLAAYEASLRSLIGVNPASLLALLGEPGQPNSAFVDPQSGAAAVYCNGERLFLNANWRNFESAGNHFGTVSNLARIHDMTGTVDRAALIVMPHDAATVQNDGNLSGVLSQGWVVRYGSYLIAGNDSKLRFKVKLPPGTGTTREMIGHKTYRLNSSMTLAPGLGAVFVLPGAGSTGGGTAPLLSDGCYTLTNLGSGLMVNDHALGSQPGTLVDQAIATGGFEQKWLLTNLGGNTVRLTNAYSILALGASRTAIYQTPAKLASSQAWRLKSLGGGVYILAQADTSLALTAPHGAKAGTLLALATLTSAANQRWKLTPVSLLPNGAYSINNGASGLVWDAQSSVLQNPANGSARQRWTVNNYSNPTISLTNAGDGNAASILYGNTEPGGLLFENGGVGGTNSFFLVRPLGKGYVSLNVQSSGLALENVKSATVPGTSIYQEPASDSLSQRWLFTPIK